MYSISRNNIWHEKKTNARARIPEVFLTNNQIHPINEGSDYTTFSSIRGSSNIELIIVNTQRLRTLNELEIWNQNICSEHNIIKITVGQARGDDSAPQNQEHRFIYQKRNIKIFHLRICRLAMASICTTHKHEDSGDLDSPLSKLVTAQSDI